MSGRNGYKKGVNIEGHTMYFWVYMDEGNHRATWQGFKNVVLGEEHDRLRALGTQKLIDSGIVVD